ncbi:MAG: hypothetical protein ACRED1_06485 [Limisphaerales bacterium]
MNGEIAQFVALVCHGNAFFAGSAVPDLLSANSTFQFCESVRFLEFTKTPLAGAREIELAANPNQWFSALLQRSVPGLRLSRASGNGSLLPDRMSSAFVGGNGVWEIEAVKRNGFSEFWRVRWDVGNRNAPNHRIWRVTCGSVAETRTSKPVVEDLNSLKGRLEQALREIHDFSEKHGCGEFTRCFSNALESLTPAAPKRGFHKDLSPNGILSSDALALLDSCQTAWVFGGMGSWNDLVFQGEDGREYDRVSDNLFRLAGEIIPAATNDSFKFV